MCWWLGTDGRDSGVGGVVDGVGDEGVDRRSRFSCSDCGSGGWRKKRKEMENKEKREGQRWRKGGEGRREMDGWREGRRGRASGWMEWSGLSRRMREGNLGGRTEEGGQNLGAMATGL